MKNLLLYLILLLAHNTCWAQTDRTKLSVTYNAYYLQYEEDDSLSWDIAKLDIGTNASRYYSMVAEWYILNPVGKAPYLGTRIKDDEVFKNMPKVGQITAIHMPGRITTHDTIHHLMEWKLVDGDSIICEYPCKKAITTFRGRTWTVWYTLDLPYSDGPWKLCGLPGLILYAKDNEGKFIFECVGIEKGDNHIFTYKNKGATVVSPERAEKLLILEAEDNDSFYKIIMPKVISMQRYDKNGCPYKWKPKTAVPYELFPKNHKQRHPQKKNLKKKR